MTTQHFSINNEDIDHKMAGRIEVTGQRISIFFDGLSTAGPEDQQRPPVVIECNQLGNPVLSIWAMIVNDKPTHQVALGGARESYRCKPTPSVEIPKESLDEWHR